MVDQKYVGDGGALMVLGEGRDIFPSFLNG